MNHRSASSKKGSSADPSGGGFKLQVAYSSMQTLVPNSSNPRNHKLKQIRQIAESIKSFGFVFPIAIDHKNRIVCGHGRYAAAQLLGLSEIPTTRLEHLSDVQIRALAIADNRLTEVSEWNDRLLAKELKALSVIDLNFNLEVTGFDYPEIDLRIDKLELVNEEGADPADALPPKDSGSQVTQLGDIWQLGRHRIICGNSLDPKLYEILLDNEEAGMIFTDPPYNVPIKGHVSGLGAHQHENFAMACGEMDEAQFTDFLARVFTLQARHSVEGSLHFVCMDWRHIGEINTAGKEVYSELKNICVWVKNNAGMGSLYRSQHELVFVFKHGRSAHQNNVQLGRFDRHRTNIWNYPGATSLGRSSDEGNLLALHPTVKPVALVADAMLDCSSRGDIVLDTFLGSGSTLIAAERLGRRCRGFEIDPLYIDTVIRRWQSFTGDDARDQATGKLFREVEMEKQNA